MRRRALTAARPRLGLRVKAYITLCVCGRDCSSGASPHPCPNRCSRNHIALANANAGDLTIPKAAISRASAYAKFACEFIDGPVCGSLA